MCFSGGAGGAGGRSLSSDNLLESESGYSSGSQHHHDPTQPSQPASQTEVRRSRLKKSLSSDGIISSHRDNAGLADLTDSEMPELAPVVVAKSGEEKEEEEEISNYLL